eukprot:CAMPEP_0181080118 /NCGR_PEP_ID=MMETSP1071-20121207/2396_1 /TAXON_ID=35127 /ORGANISM="Thalassiosira sp., Strain NH16" /LENGTH=601 /DNA_ID=CAMNT_0023161573 /DNA_START=178 /DNA_END=1983 /DNA_ORIENTATION=-
MSPFNTLEPSGSRDKTEEGRRPERESEKLQHGNDSCRVKNNNFQFEPLGLPGGFGRDQLLRPFSKVCPTCRRDRRPKITEKSVEASAASAVATKERSSSNSSRPSFCGICRSIQSVAKFIPRNDFWRFSSEGDNDDDDDDDDCMAEKKLYLSISGKNTSRLVRVSSSGGEFREFDSARHKEEPKQKLEVNDGDIVSLLWYKGNDGSGECVINASLSSLQPLIQFRLTRIHECTGTATAIEDQSGNQVSGPLPIEAGNSTEENLEKNAKDDAKTQVEKSGMIEHGAVEGESAVQNENERMKSCNSEGDASSSSSDDEHLWNASGFLKAGTKEAKVARGNYFRSVREKCGGDHRNSRTEQHRENNPDSSNPEALWGRDPCNQGIHNNGSKEEEEEEESESAPLTLPSRFLASCSKSFSFDSVEKSSSHPLKSSLDSGAVCSVLNNGTPQKRTYGGKRPHADMGLIGEEKESITAKTPKKSNVTIADAKASARISSLSYEQIVQLHKDSTSTSSDAKLSLRHAVLSLTLALTSGASSYDSNFLRDCNSTKKVRDTKCSRTMNTSAQTSSPQHQHSRQRWMPRLLQGTQIKSLDRRNDTDNASED